MGFFEKLFGGKSAKEGMVFEKNQLLPYVEEYCLSDSKSLEKEVFSKLAELKHLLKSADSIVSDIHSKDFSLKDGNFRLRRVVMTSKENLFSRFRSLVLRLEPPKTFDLNSVYEFVLSSKNLVENEVMYSRKNIAYTGALLAQEVRELGKLLQEIHIVFSELQAMFSKSNYVKLTRFKRNFSEFEIAEKEALSARLAAEQNRALVEELSLSHKRLLVDEQELKNSSFAKELSFLEEQKKSLFEQKNILRQKFLSILERIDKPLTRFLKIASSDSSIMSAEEKELAGSYFQNIFIASKKDPKGEELKKIVSKVLSFVESGAIQLKEKEKQKKIAALKEMLEYDFFSEIFWKLNSIESELLSVEKKISEAGLSKKMAQLSIDLARLSRDIEARQSEGFKLSLKAQQKQKDALALKFAIEEEAQSILGKKISIDQH